jgi:hypothetical protein
MDAVRNSDESPEPSIQHAIRLERRAISQWLHRVAEECDKQETPECGKLLKLIAKHIQAGLHHLVNAHCNEEANGYAE